MPRVSITRGALRELVERIAPRASTMAFLVLALFADSALAQKADQPDVKVGDQWQFVVYYTVASTQPNRAWVITSVTSMGIEGTENGELLMLTPELNVLESPINSQIAGETTGTYWYAPTARAIVKSVYYNPYLGTSTVELVEFQLRP